MSEQNQGNNPDASAIIPVKRKRGRPRKYPRPDIDQRRSGNVTGDPNLGYGENTRAPLAHGGVNGIQPRQANPVDDTNNMVGQLVHGVVDATFDAGYLLTVRVGTSDTTLRGVVFKPGHYVPVSGENDVAPGVQMVRRNEIPVPRETYTHGYGHGHGHRSRERNRSGLAARSSAVASRGKRLPLVMTQTPPSISRGNVVPVVLRPVNISNGLNAASISSGAIHVGHSVSPQGKQELNTAHPSNGSTPSNLVACFQSQNNNQPSAAPSVSGPSNKNPAQLLAEANSMPLAGMPFEKLLTEVIKRVPVPSQSIRTDSNSVGGLPTKDPGLDSDDACDSDQALSIEPLQTIQPGRLTQPAVATKPLEEYGTGKMTELLQVLQENMMENQATWSKGVDEGNKLKLDELKNPEPELEDVESDRSNKRSRTSSV